MHIDSVGQKYTIKEIFKVKYVGLWGFNPFLKGRQILVDFKYEPTVQNVSFDDFKKEVIERVLKNKKFWESAWDISELKQEVQKSTTLVQ